MVHKFKRNGVIMATDINSGAVHVIDDLVYELLGETSVDNDKKKNLYLENTYGVDTVKAAMAEINELTENGMLYSAPDTESESITRNQSIIKAMCLHVAHDCNLSCEYCFAAEGTFHGERGMMSEETGKKALDLLVKRSGSRRQLEVDFFGGEPLLNFPLIKKLVHYGRSLEKTADKRFRFTLTTNGLALTEEIMDYINEEMDNVVLSLDGRRSVNDRMRKTLTGEGSYDAIQPRISQMVQKRGSKPYFVRGTFTARHLDFAADVIHMSDLGYDQISVEPVVGPPEMEYALQENHIPIIEKEYEKLAEAYLQRKGTENEFRFFHFILDLKQGPCMKKRASGCGAGTEYLAVTPEGDLYPCHQFVGQKDFCLGTVDSGPVNNSKLESFANATIYDKPACMDCWAKYYCSGGCHANAYFANHQLNQPYEIGCQMEKIRIETAMTILALESEESE
ncbi:MAG: thioether cross-link-forming SCIFF peptide maturase [Tindallia sp. MSAO_Bac2]|nr:MAG: thioether cross-link-forming SCIFF peptide maturase [Tindallia sp. MSAO_Bac2]